MGSGSGRGSGSSGGGGSDQQDQHQKESFWVGVFRGFGGALLFSMPILMTMEMWWLGFYMGRAKLAIFLLVMTPMILVLAYFAGLKQTASKLEAAVDGMTAYGIGIVTTAIVLLALGIITLWMPLREVAGKIAILSPAAAFGAILARSQFGGAGGGGKQEEKAKKQRGGYLAQMFFVAAGAFYLAATVAATEEMILIPFKMTAWHAAGLLVLSVVVMHAFLYTMKFGGAPDTPPGTPWWSIFVRYTLPGYVVALAMCWYVLWTFDRFEAYSPHWMAMYTIVLGFPGAVGGAAGRLIL